MYAQLTPLKPHVLSCHIHLAYIQKIKTLCLLYFPVNKLLNSGYVQHKYFSLYTLVYVLQPDFKPLTGL